ncbi:MAG: hypothetical protein V3T05_04805 [Myxococcota bacterium]
MAYARELFWRVLECRGAGKNQTQEALLELIGAAGDPSSVGFLTDTLRVVRARDKFARERQGLALCGLAMIVIEHGDNDALAALVEAMEEPPAAAVGGLAAQCVVRAMHLGEQLLPDAILATMKGLVEHGSDFSTRYLAAKALADLGLEIPRRYPNGVYRFEVGLEGHRFRCVVDVRSDQTLEDLRCEIHDAFRWDHDHLFAFFLNGKVHDGAFAVVSSWHEGDGADDQPSTDEAVLGELGLEAKHRFAYFFDYGDNNRFEIKILEVRDRERGRRYPRIIETTGRAPEQYRF